MPAGTANSAGPAPFAELLLAAQQGQGWAFEVLFDQWSQPLAAFAAARGVEEVDDVVSETFLSVFRSVGGFRGDERDFRSWLYRVLRNRITDCYRKAGRRPATVTLGDTARLDGSPLSTAGTVSERPFVGGDVEADALRALGRRRVAELLEELTDDQIEVLLLRIVGDLTVAQVAEVMGRSQGAVKAHQRRALARLRKLVANDATLADEADPIGPPATGGDQVAGRSQTPCGRNELAGGGGQAPGRNELAGGGGQAPGRDEPTGGGGQVPGRDELAGGDGQAPVRNDLLGRDETGGGQRSPSGQRPGGGRSDRRQPPGGSTRRRSDEGW